MPDERTEIDPAEYFNPDGPIPSKSLLGKIWVPTVLGAAGIGTACFTNMFNRRPALSGIQRHLVLGIAGVFLGIVGSKWAARRQAHRDFVLYNYIVNHPEDFPPIERKKYAEVLESWVPIR